MIPFKDDNPTRIFPFITIVLIVLNTLVLFIQIASPEGGRDMALAYGAIPYLLMTFKTVQPIHPLTTVFTSMFMHGGLIHLISNMLFLWIFGNNIEDRLGHIRFILFYLLCGLIAVYAHALTDPSSRMPMIGASGAVSGILGAYILLFPRAKIYTLVFFGFFVDVIKLPAKFVISFWIVIQFINGLVSKGVSGNGGVAWFAHIGGFLAGLLLIKIFMPGRRGY